MPALILGADTRLRAVVDWYKRLTWTRRLSSPGSWQMVVPRHLPGAAAIEAGQIVAPLWDGPSGTIDALFLVERIESVIDEQGHASEDLTLSGRSLAGWLEERICIPPTGVLYDFAEGPAETVMKTFVNRHAANPADPARAVPLLAVAADGGRGPYVSHSARYHKLLEVLQEIADVAGYGFEVRLDAAARRWVFDIIAGLDRTVGNAAGNAPVILSQDLGTARQIRHLVDQVGAKTFAYVLGQGEGILRQVAVVEASPGQSGWARREVALDARDLPAADQLTRRGQAALARLAGQDSVTAEMHPNTALRYRRDWDLGDLVTVSVPEWGLRVNLRIVGVSVTYAPGRGAPEVRVELGKPIPTQRELAQREAIGVYTPRESGISLQPVPRGVITLWWGSLDSVPAGWAPCDGRTYTAPDGTPVTTPDLRDRFVVGAGGSYAVGATGGAAQVTLGIEHIPQHDHGGSTGAWSGSTGTAGAHSHRVGRDQYLGGPEVIIPESVGTASGDASLYYPTTTDGDHSHAIPSHAHAISPQGGGQPHENRPPYFALLYIMKL